MPKRDRQRTSGPDCSPLPRGGPAESRRREKQSNPVAGSRQQRCQKAPGPVAEGHACEKYRHLPAPRYSHGQPERDRKESERDHAGGLRQGRRNRQHERHRAQHEAKNHATGPATPPEKLMRPPFFHPRPATGTGTSHFSGTGGKKHQPCSHAGSGIRRKSKQKHCPQGHRPPHRLQSFTSCTGEALGRGNQSKHPGPHGKDEKRRPGARPPPPA